MTTTRVEARINLPLDESGHLPTRQTILAHTTETPGLVVFPVLTGILTVDNDWWNVTHAASGKRLPFSFRTTESATAFANALGSLCDWESARPQVRVEQVFPIAHEHGGINDWEYMAERRKTTA